MNEHIRLLIEDLKQIWEKLNINQKFSISALITASIIIGIFFIAKATEPTWSVLYTDLQREDVAAITESLKKSGYPYKLSDDNTSILVRNQDKEDLKLFVAENDLIRDTSGGFELLDDLQMGSTDFKNKLTKQRIFQGELIRSIEKINGVSKARVQLADPDRSIFSDEDEDPSASVVLILEPGIKLKPSQILAIKNLVAYAVPRLSNDRVFLTDQFGNILSEDVSKNSSDMQTYRTNFEKEAAKKIQDTLETIMGKDNISVQVSTVMDFNQTRSTIESYTPNKDSNSGIIVSQQGEKEVYSNPQQTNDKENTPIKNINTTQNDEQAQAAIDQNPEIAQAPLNETAVKTTNFEEKDGLNTNDNSKKLSYEKEKQATTYAVTKEIKQVVYAPGSVIKMSVAVAVNKILTAEEKQEIENLVIAAAGMDTARGDIVNVTSLKFTGSNSKISEQEKQELKLSNTLDILNFLFKNASPVVIILILCIIALNNFGNIFRELNQGHTEEDVSALEGDNIMEEQPSFDPYLMMQQNQTNTEDFYEAETKFTSAVDKKKHEIINIILENPEEAARVLTAYMKD